MKFLNVIRDKCETEFFSIVAANFFDIIAVMFVFIILFRMTDWIRHNICHDIYLIKQSKKTSKTLENLKQFRVNLFNSKKTFLFSESTEVNCPYCNQKVMTSVTYESSSTTCFYACCLDSSLPFCMDSMKDALHNCPNCKAFLGKHAPK